MHNFDVGALVLGAGTVASTFQGQRRKRFAFHKVVFLIDKMR